jgi:ATP-dependent helicase HrpA
MEEQIKLCMIQDQFSLRRECARMRSIKDEISRSSALHALQTKIDKSLLKVNKRRQRLPDVRYPPDLPVSEKRAEIASALKAHQIIVVAGETGSGKTTQIPKICLELGFGIRGLIGHTQPRRLAARSVATRIAEELGETLGQGVGYQVRFQDNTSEDTFIKLMTDGILLAEIQQDRYLNKYEVLIVDEAHERSLNIDFLLGYLKGLCRQRPDLKVIITSATIDVGKFSRHFSDAPVISVSGRTYPVEIVYQDPTEIDAEDEDILLSGVVRALRTFESIEKERRQPAGDVLVFLSGEREIRDLALSLRKHELKHTEITPLYARLSQSEQQRIFAPHTGRRIILSTNVAETSLTVPGIRYVIDSGMARISRYSVQSKVQRLPIEPVSQASANQRAGRCGRVASGVCVRLYSEADFQSRPLYTDPEIQRTNLSAVILQMLLLKLGEIGQFPFVEAPDRRAINDGFRLLDELGAITRDRQLTQLGRDMARIPADPRLARMLLATCRHPTSDAGQAQGLYQLLIIVSALSVQDPRETPADKRQVARERHQQYTHPESDFLSWVQLWELVECERQALNQGQFRKYCKENFLSWPRLREWRETHRQLALSCHALGYKVKHRDDEVPPSDADYEAIHKAMLTGSLNQLGQKTQEGLYLGSRGKKFSLFPTSCLYKKMPRWILTAELIETSRLFATMAARIEPEWVVDVASHLLKRDYFEAHWEKKRGEVIAFEKISLYGLVLIEKRRVSFGAIDPKISRDIFIREGLVAGEIDTKIPFYRHNSALISEIKDIEEKERKPDILVSDDELAAFYEKRLPAEINNLAALERWCRKQQQSGQTPLHMSRDDVTRRVVDEGSKYAFPEHAHIQHNALKINYRFAPGSADDGISIDVPEPLVPSLTQADLDWAVPGLVQERCIALIRGLPKSLRKLFVPVPEFINVVLASDQARMKPPLTQLLTEQAWQQKRIRIPEENWDESGVPLHLRPRIRVLTADKSILKESLSLQSLQRETVNRFHAAALSAAAHPMEIKNLQDWTFGELPLEIETDAGVKLKRYPALQDCQTSVCIVLCETQSKARLINQRGLARLLMLRTQQQKGLILKSLRGLKQSLGLKLLDQEQDWQDNAVMAIYRLSFDLSNIRPANPEEFGVLLARGRGELMGTAERICRLLHEVYVELFEIRRRLASLSKQLAIVVQNDIAAQLDFLFRSGFPDAVPDAWLWEYPRYLKAINTRLDRLAGLSGKDQELQQVLSRLEARFQAMQPSRQEQIADFPWMLQELRVSLFAQTLGTRYPVSEKRLGKRLDEVLA